MKNITIKNAYIKNKPQYNYSIFDEDNTLIAKGHLINSKQKQQILKHMNYDIDQNGQLKYKIDSMIDFYAEWIIKSIDWWIWEDLPITIQSVYQIDLEVIQWLSEQVQLKISQSIQKVEQNSKN